VIALALVGVAAAAWQSFGPVDAAGCSLTLADRIVQATTLDVRLPFLFSATANCDEANVPLLGIPFAIWSMLTFVIITLMMIFASASTLLRNAND
jgi:disulfide bond formation protein DsbB